jgi:hypothetical protein
MYISYNYGVLIKAKKTIVFFRPKLINKNRNS